MPTIHNLRNHRKNAWRNCQTLRHTSENIESKQSTRPENKAQREEVHHGP